MFRRLFNARNLVVGLAVCLVLVAGYKELLEDQLFPKRFGVVEPSKIYRSAQLHPAIIDQVLSDYHIQVVVDLQYWEEKPALLAEQAAIDARHLTSFRFPLNGDGTGDIESYVRAIEEIHKAVQRGDPVLVHCAAGSQRTGGVLAAYRTLVQGQPVASAITEMEAYDWDPVKDHVLLVYLDAHMAELAHKLKQAGVIPVVPDPLPAFL